MNAINPKYPTLNSLPVGFRIFVTDHSLTFEEFAAANGLNHAGEQLAAEDVAASWKTILYRRTATPADLGFSQAWIDAVIAA